MRRTLLAAPLLILVALADAEPAEAAHVQLGLGANYWFVKSGVFTATLGIEVPVANLIAVGGRAGGLLATDPTTGAIPIDLAVRIVPTRSFFIEVFGGPWIFFDDPGVQAHFSVGLGTSAGSVTFMVEIGYLDPRAIIGGTIGIRL